MSSTDELEMSSYEGRPVQLFDFNRGNIHWRYARADQDVLFQREVYKALNIGESGVRQMVEASENDLSITVPNESEIAQLYVSNTPSDRMYVTIWVYDLDSDSTDQGRMYWKGSVAGKGSGDNGSAKLNCQDLSVGFSRAGLRLAWERQCPHTLYDQECKVNPEAFKVVGSLLFARGNTLQADILGNFADGWFSGGFCSWEIAPGIFQRRGIEAHNGTSVTVIGGVSTLAPGTVMNFYPGCAHDIATCDTKFNNKLNHGGVVYLKGTSPFDGNPVFN
jgi:uncharacterized phage protein (TIGR02218 family)